LESGLRSGSFTCSMNMANKVSRDPDEPQYLHLEVPYDVGFSWWLHLNGERARVSNRVAELLQHKGVRVSSEQARPVEDRFGLRLNGTVLEVTWNSGHQEDHRLSEKAAKMLSEGRPDLVAAQGTPTE